MKLSSVRLKILMRLEQMSHGSGQVKLHCKEVARELIPDGLGSISCDRYLRWLREEGFITYPDPRSNNHYYNIELKYL